MKRNRHLFFICIICICMLPQTMGAQTAIDKKISLSFNNEPLPTVLKRLEKLSGYKILFTYDDVRNYTVSGSVKEKSVKQALEIIIGDKPLKYKIENQFITITLSGSVRQSVSLDVEGEVVSGDDGQPLIGATVTIKGAGAGVVTDIDGKFRLEKVPEGATLQFSYIGMLPQELSPRPVMKVTLKADVQVLKEVVVTGMQKMDKRLFTGASDKLSASDVKLDGLADISRGLEGRSAGVSVQNISGTFGTAPKIRVRGATSIFGSSKPLWVVDGVIMEDVVEVSADQLSSGDAETLISSAIAGLNADDIESFQILKDGSATSIYGARAMAGVIVVTTKKGRSGVSKLSYNSELTTRMIPSYNNFNIMNSQEQMGIYKEMHEKGWLNFSETARNANTGVYGKMYQLLNTYDPVTGQFMLLNTEKARNAYLRAAEMRNTDWFSQLFSERISQTHSASISMGGDKALVYASLSLMNDPGWYEQSSVNRYTANLNATYNILQNLSINLISNASYRKQRAPGTLGQDIDVVSGQVKRDFDINPYSYALNTSRTLDPKEYYTGNYAPFNIHHELQNNYMDFHIADVKFQGELKWKVRPNLELSVLGSVRHQSTSQEHQIKDDSNQAEAYRAGLTDKTIMDHNSFLYTDPDNPYALPITILPEGGIFRRTDYKMLGYDFRTTASWNRVFNETHITNFFAGTEINSGNRSRSFFRGWGMQYNMGEIPYYIYHFFKKSIEEGNDYYSLNRTRGRNVAFFANATYSYKGKYIVNGTARYEGTNRLGRSRAARWLPTWNISGAWNAHEESFFESFRPAVSHFTLKASYSLTADRGPADVTNSNVIITSFAPYRPFTKSKEIGLFIRELENSELTYEKKHELNIGLDMGFLNNRLNLAFDWYRRNNFDLIGHVNTQGVGGQIDKMANVASMKSHGIELTLSTKNIQNKDFQWNTDFIFSNTKNEITGLKGNANVMSLISGVGFAKEGYPSRGLFSIPFKGLNEKGIPMILNEKGEVTTTDINFQEREHTDFLVYEGPTDPTLTGSLGNIFTYRGFRLNLFITYSFGNVIRLNPIFNVRYSDLTSMTREFKNRWTLVGDEAMTHIPSILDKRDYESNVNVRYAYNAYNYSTERIAKGDFIRMKEISLSYDFPSSWISEWKLSNLSLKLQATNLFLIYADKKLNGQDPEFFNAGGVASPIPQQFTLTLKLGI